MNNAQVTTYCESNNMSSTYHNNNYENPILCLKKGIEIPAYSPYSKYIYLHKCGVVAPDVNALTNLHNMTTPYSKTKESCKDYICYISTYLSEGDTMISRVNKGKTVKPFLDMDCNLFIPFSSQKPLIKPHNNRITNNLPTINTI